MLTDIQADQINRDGTGKQGYIAVVTLCRNSSLALRCERTHQNRKPRSGTTPHLTLWSCWQTLRLRTQCTQSQPIASIPEHCVLPPQRRLTIAIRNPHQEALRRRRVRPARQRGIQDLDENSSPSLWVEAHQMGDLEFPNCIWRKFREKEIHTKETSHLGTTASVPPTLDAECNQEALPASASNMRRG